MRIGRETVAAHQFGFARAPRQPRWPSFAVAIALTLAIFAAAFTSMRRVPHWLSSRSAERPVQVSLRLEPPPAPIPRRAPEPPSPKVRPTNERVVAPVSEPTVVQPPTPVVAPPVQPLPIARDTGAVGEKPGNQPTAPPASAAGTRLGAPIAPAGVSRIIAPPSVQAHRDFAADSAHDAAFAAMWKKPTSAAVQKEIDDSRRAAAAVARRATTAGNAADVHIAQGDGYGGAGAVGGAGSSLTSGSIGLPFLSKGPSAAQRRKNDSVDADNRARLGRLQELIKHRRDSVLADSLRRDSLARLRRP